MGCFDTVNFKCPTCGSSLNIQSKAGECRLKEFFITSVPMDIALDGETVTCSECSTVVKICIPAAVPKRVAMEVSIGTGREWD